MYDVNLNNTEIAFKHRSRWSLIKARILFTLFSFRWLIKVGSWISVWAIKLHLPVKWLIRATIFKQFCGGESVKQCLGTADHLYKQGIGSILDYSVESAESEKGFDDNFDEIVKTIHTSKDKEAFPFAVFKTTGIGRFALLEKVHAGTKLTKEENEEWEKVRFRFTELCRIATENEVRIFIDAEDSWIQDPIDELALDMMRKYNTKKACVFNTLQMYRKGRMEYLESLFEIAEKEDFYLGFKLVRGAYMEKERARAKEKGYEDPIQDTKALTNRYYDHSVRFCFDNRKRIAICLGTHNEDSSKLLVEFMETNKIDPKDERYWFAQLYGMSDNITYNIAHGGFNVAKYLPYGPIAAAMPYLSRRAEENSSVSGQAGRELNLIKKELFRRTEVKLAKKHNKK